MAISVSQTYAEPTHQVSMVFYVVAQVLFNLGPNTLTFILAAEILSTEVRGTSYGIAAAFGKLGAIIARAIIKRAGKSQSGIVIVRTIFYVVLAVMALLVWIEPWGIAFPRIQEGRSLKRREGSWSYKIMEDISPWPLEVKLLLPLASRAGPMGALRKTASCSRVSPVSVSSFGSYLYHGLGERKGFTRKDPEDSG